MANKRISDLTEATSTTTGDVLAIDGTTTRKVTVENLLGDNVTAIKAVTSAADKGIQFTGPGTVATYDLTAAGKALLDDADAAAQRTTLGSTSVGDAVFIAADESAAQTALGLAIGTDVQAYDADLAALATNIASGLWARTGAGTGATRTITGTTNEIDVSAGDGVSDNPTISISASYAASLLADPTGVIGLTAVNGSAGTATRSDGTAALSQAIVPTWTGLHTFADSVNISGNPSFAISSTVNPYFGADSVTSQAIQMAAGSATAPETGLQIVGTSDVGGANATSAFKIGVFASVTASAGSSDIYPGNFVGQLSSGVDGGVQCLVIEGDLNVHNAHYGDTVGAPSQPYATPFYLALGGTMRASAMMMVNTTAPANRGLVFWSGNGNSFRLNTIEDWMTSGSFAMIGGTYAGAVIDMSQATISSNIGMKLPNSKFVSWRNGANSADINAIAVNSSNQVVIGSGSTGVAMQGTTSNNSAASGNVGEYNSASAASSAVPLSSGAANNLTSISLTAGDWEVSGIAAIQPAAGATISQVWTYISVTSATLGTDVLANGATLHTLPFTTGNLQQIATGVARISLASTATVYLQAYPAFSGGTVTGGGGIRARRVR